MKNTEIEQVPATLEHTMSVIRSDVDMTAPTILRVVSADLLSFPADGNIVIEFSEAIAAGNGRIALLDMYGAVAFEEPIDGSRITITGNVLTWDIAGDLPYGVHYSIELKYGTVRDLAGIEFQGGQSNYFVVELSQASLVRTGGAGRDWLYGSQFADTLDGGSDGSDQISGLGGNDILVGGDESPGLDGDSMNGGEVTTSCRAMAAMTTWPAAQVTTSYLAAMATTALRGGSATTCLTEVAATTV